MNQKISLASPDDAAAISAFAAKSFTHSFGHLYPPEDLASFLSIWNQAPDLAAQAQDEQWALAVARFDDGRISGFIKLGPIDFDLPAGQPAARATELHQLYVHPDAKGKGIAPALMDFGMAWAKNRANILYLSVFSENPRAQKFYARYGFYDVGRNPFRVGNHIDEDRIWRCDLVPPFETADCLSGVKHGFFGRQGGVSSGALASLNCGIGSNDEPALIAENRQHVVSALAPSAKLAGLYQVHGNHCAIIDENSDLNVRIEGDAMATSTQGIMLGILTADCVPVLFYDAQNQVIGAAHAGWKGALAGITDNTIAAMESLGASRDHIAAAIGPSIGRASYEVDDGFVQRFCEDDPANEIFFAAHKPGHAMFDIAAYVTARLAKLGLKRIAITGQDTYAEANKYFSYRRACHRNENSYGRQLSVICL